MNTRFYEVTVATTKTMVIEVEDDGDEASQMTASDYAFENAFFSGDVEVLSVEHLKTEHQVEQSKRLCDEFLPL